MLSTASDTWHQFARMWTNARPLGPRETAIASSAEHKPCCIFDRELISRFEISGAFIRESLRSRYAGPTIYYNPFCARATSFHLCSVAQVRLLNLGTESEILMISMKN